MINVLTLILEFKWYLPIPIRLIITINIYNFNCKYTGKQDNYIDTGDNPLSIMI